MAVEKFRLISGCSRNNHAAGASVNLHKFSCTMWKPHRYTSFRSSLLKSCMIMKCWETIAYGEQTANVLQKTDMHQAPQWPKLRMMIYTRHEQTATLVYLTLGETKMILCTLSTCLYKVQKHSWKTQGNKSLQTQISTNCTNNDQTNHRGCFLCVASVWLCCSAAWASDWECFILSVLFPGEICYSGRCQTFLLWKYTHFWTFQTFLLSNSCQFRQQHKNWSCSVGWHIWLCLPWIHYCYCEHKELSSTRVWAPKIMADTPKTLHCFIVLEGDRQLF